jgi:FkbM family methyltransferase
MAADPLIGDRVYTARSGLTRGLRRKGGYEFLPLPRRTTSEETFLQRLDLLNRTVYDIGGGRGRFTLFFARASGVNGRVITFEPNPVNYQSIVEQVALNGFSNVLVRQTGLGASAGTATLAFRPSDPGRGSVSEAIVRRTLSRSDAVTVTVEVDTLDHQIAALGLPSPEFIKIDVEGAEFGVLNGAAVTLSRHRPALFLELHGTDVQDKSRNARRIVQSLADMDYMVWHVESDRPVEVARAEEVREGHLFCHAQSADWGRRNETPESPSGDTDR